MEKLRIALNQRIKIIFDELREKTDYQSKYWKECFFELETGEPSEIHISKLESYFLENVDLISDEELIDIHEFVSVESMLFDHNGYNNY